MPRLPLHIIMLGPPGAGKGTQAVLLSQALQIPHISTGDIFREEINKQSPLGIQVKHSLDNGLLVPDEVVLNIVKKRLLQEDCREGYILDGFPRTLHQARMMAQDGMSVNRLVLLDVAEKTILDRLSGRRTCPECHRMYHDRFNPPKSDSICDDCHVPLIRRKDDEEDTIRHRIKIYSDQTSPLIDFFTHDCSIPFLRISGEMESIERPADISIRIQNWLRELL